MFRKNRKMTKYQELLEIAEKTTIKNNGKKYESDKRSLRKSL